MNLRRHDLVWLTPGHFDARGPLDAWIRADRPLVVTRQADIPADKVRVGVTLVEPTRARIALVVPRAAIHRHAAPPLLADAIESAPPPWRERLHAVVAASASNGFVPRIYGSLATEFLTGVRCLRETSDVDLLLDWDGGADLVPLLSALEGLGDDLPPRLDGEVRRGDGAAVAWRELWQAMRGDATSTRVLAKRDATVEMVPGSAFMSGAARHSATSS